jgi:hypothetical protein
MWMQYNGAEFPTNGLPYFVDSDEESNTRTELRAQFYKKPKDDLLSQMTSKLSDWSKFFSRKKKAKETAKTKYI